MSKVTSKLQVTIPKAIAEAYDIHPGSELRWVPAGDAIRVESEGAQVRSSLPVEKRLAHFVRMMKRIDRLPALPPVPHGEGRGWTREELYAERLERYGRPR
ncbi:AbrB/MazE/SpoVT family DNA-binding domain-containing protein [bacterium]|nr:MAG: AbrB/MazE/SpoVT family DNA-binding domain-containing protein [bacterium]